MLKGIYARRVRRGSVLLDQQKPDWFRKVDLDKLSIYSNRNCILGQVYESYSVGRGALGLVTGLHHGFLAKGNFSEKRLERSWRREIRARIAAAASRS